MGHCVLKPERMHVKFRGHNRDYLMICYIVRDTLTQGCKNEMEWCQQTRHCTTSGSYSNVWIHNVCDRNTSEIVLLFFANVLFHLFNHLFLLPVFFLIYCDELCWLFCLFIFFVFCKMWAWGAFTHMIHKRKMIQYERNKKRELLLQMCICICNWIWKCYEMK